MLVSGSNERRKMTGPTRVGTVVLEDLEDMAPYDKSSWVLWTWDPAAAAFLTSNIGADYSSALVYWSIIMSYSSPEFFPLSFLWVHSTLSLVCSQDHKFLVQLLSLPISFTCPSEDFICLKIMSCLLAPWGKQKQWGRSLPIYVWSFSRDDFSVFVIPTTIRGVNYNSLCRVSSSLCSAPSWSSLFRLCFFSIPSGVCKDHV